MKISILVFSALLTSSSLGFEINTHQAITRCALSNLCETNGKGRGGSENLNFFVYNMRLDSEDYESNVLEDYENKTYFKYAEEGEGLGENDPKDHTNSGKFIDFIEGKTYLKGAKNESGDITDTIDFAKNSYISLIEAGSILEDALFPHVTTIPEIRDADGRFNNHFYSAQFSATSSDRAGWNPIARGMNSGRLSTRALLADGTLDAYGTRTDNIAWALDDSVSWVSPADFGVEAHTRRNDYTITDAFNYYKESFKGSIEDRRKNQAKLFVSIGHILHLLEDLHSPAHVRNGPHAGGDYLEIYGRHDGGFLLRNGELAKTNNNEITTAVKNVDIKAIMLHQEQHSYISYQDFFIGEALWTSQNFFSEAHEMSFFESENFQTGEGLELDDDRCGDKSTTIFDVSRNPSLDRSQTSLVRMNSYWDYIKTNGNVSEIKGDVSNQTVLGFSRRSSIIFGPSKCTSMISPRTYTVGNTSYSNFDKTALRDTAKNVIPRAVASAQAFTNFFFRGRMEASLSFDNHYIIIKNISDPNLVSYKELLTFKKDIHPNLRKSFSLFYIDDTGKSTQLGDGFPLLQDIDATINGSITNNKYAIKIGNILDGKNIQVGDNDKLILLFDGQIGQDAGIDDYHLDARGLSATYVKKSLVKQTEQSISYSNFDDGWYQKGVIPFYIRNPRVNFDDPNSDKHIDTVLDVVTGLQWQDNTDVGTIEKPWRIVLTPVNYSDTSGDTATTYCTDLRLGGYNNWRLPSVNELLSLADYSRTWPAIDINSFKNNSSTSSYWSSTGEISTVSRIIEEVPTIIYVDTPRAWVVGSAYSFSARRSKLNFGSVRCVRSVSIP